MQAALPVTVAHRLASWRRPLVDLAARLPEVTADAARLQLGGPVGDRAAFGAEAPAVAARMAQALGLAEPGHAWHAERGAVVACGDWLSHLAGHLGRIGQDVALMAQQGVGTVELAGGGASSAMAHKRNPVQAETLVALARFAAAQAGGLHGALVHEQERSGAAWTLEWLLLPPLAAAAGASLRIASDLLGQITRLGDPV
jgi:3-carboxy-cis,cis-muconate cycloisomerase